MSNGENGDAVLDPNVVEEMEESDKEDLFTEYHSKGSESPDQEKVQVFEDWLPDKDDWSGKTIIHPRQAQSLAAVRMLADFFDEVEEIEDNLKQMVNHYEEYLTSIDGTAREQQVKTMAAMFGRETELEESQSVLLGSLGQPDGQENE